MEEGRGDERFRLLGSSMGSCYILGVIEFGGVLVLFFENDLI